MKLLRKFVVALFVANSAFSSHAAAPNASPLGNATGLFVARDAAGADVPLALIDGALFRLSADGRTAANLVLGVSDTRINTFALDAATFNNVVYVGTPQTGVWKTTDGGTTWSQRNTGLSCQNVTAYAVASSTRHLLTAQCDNVDTIWVSQDSGQSWTARASFAPGIRVYRLSGSLSSGTRSFARTSGGLWVSQDEGVTWIQVAQNTQGLFALRSIPLDADVLDFTNASSAPNPLTEIVLVQGRGPYYAADSSSSDPAKFNYRLVTAGLPNPAVFGRRLSVVGQRFYLPVRGAGLFRLNDLATAWELAISEQAVPGVDRVFQFNQDPQIWFAQSRTSGIWRSTDGGTTWARWGVTSVAVLPPAPNSAGQTFTIPAGTVPETAVEVTTVGPITQRTITAQLDVALLPVPQTEARFQVYVIALLPGSAPTLFLKGPDAPPSDWGPITTPLRAFIRNVALGSQDQRLIIEIIKDADLSALVGAEFYIGYGKDDADLISNRRYRGVYKIVR